MLAVWRSLSAWAHYAALWLSTLWLALALAWSLLAPFDFGYPLWYRVMDIGAHLDRYASQNIYKPGFQNLSAAEHQALFGALRKAVQQGGAGLDSIGYRGPDGHWRALLRPAERGHLQDVAWLLQQARWLTLAMALLWGLLWWRRRRAAVLSSGQQLAGLALLGGPLVLWLLWSGPTAVFYQFHHWLFRAGHPWFFYWEESLMSSLMKAPMLFGGIALLLAALAWPSALLLYWLARPRRPLDTGGAVVPQSL